MKHKKTNILLGIVAAGYLSIALANIGLNGMIDGHGNPEQAKGMAWGVKMADATLVNATPENSSYLTLDVEAVDVSNKYSSDFYLQNGTVFAKLFWYGIYMGQRRVFGKNGRV